MYEINYKAIFENRTLFSYVKIKTEDKTLAIKIFWKWVKKAHKTALDIRIDFITKRNVQYNCFDREVEAEIKINYEKTLQVHQLQRSNPKPNSFVLWNR